MNLLAEVVLKTSALLDSGKDMRAMDCSTGGDPGVLFMESRLISSHSVVLLSENLKAPAEEQSTLMQKEKTTK